ncbi:hypothetical protein [Bacillus sp. RAR_GA_16]|uniref:YphA family membrane protein n=1 Tax=Bacillus sp. RAR_GA_16 TaxID=2876774 RepID=UPI001CC9DEE9|nr:hypothetical protein [Bacillus sp. RAR_GA_16]MCA0172101.1 hypothetical protein [Bacillus sp. RAR_GA_16]
MDGIIFVWFAWIGWVIAVFFQNESSKRTRFIFVLLFAICLIHITIPVFYVTVSAIWLLALATGYLLLLKYRINTIYAVIILLTLTAAFTAVQLFSIYDPVFTFLYTKWSVSAILLVIIHLTISGTGERCSFLILSIVHGELILGMFFKGMGFDRLIGELASLDILAISIMSTVAWSGFVNVTIYLEKLLKKHQERRGYS